MGHPTREQQVPRGARDDKKVLERKTTQDPPLRKASAQGWATRPQDPHPRPTLTNRGWGNRLWLAGSDDVNEGCFLCAGCGSSKKGVAGQHAFRIHARFVANGNRFFAHVEVGAKNKSVSLELSRLHQSSGKIAAENVGLVGFFPGIPGHHQQTFELAGGPFGVKAIHDGHAAGTEFARVDARVLGAIRERGRFGVSFRVLPGAAIEFDQSFHLRRVRWLRARGRGLCLHALNGETCKTKRKKNRRTNNVFYPSVFHGTSPLLFKKEWPAIALKVIRNVSQSQPVLREFARAGKDSRRIPKSHRYPSPRKRAMGHATGKSNQLSVIGDQEAKEKQIPLPRKSRERDDRF